MDALFKKEAGGNWVRVWKQTNAFNNCEAAEDRLEEKEGVKTHTIANE
jgi:hypothetical protein